MCEGLLWTQTVLIIDVKGFFFEKVIKYWLRLIEASMASMVSMQVFQNVYFGIQHSKIRVQYVYITKYDNE